LANCGVIVNSGEFCSVCMLTCLSAEYLIVLVKCQSVILGLFAGSSSLAKTGLLLNSAVRIDYFCSRLLVDYLSTS